ncbi:unnamed protein product, partial [Ectocarpus sp. 13 AM-2016]
RLPRGWVNSISCLFEHHKYRQAPLLPTRFFAGLGHNLTLTVICVPRRYIIRTGILRHRSDFSRQGRLCAAPFWSARGSADHPMFKIQFSNIVCWALENKTALTLIKFVASSNPHQRDKLPQSTAAKAKVLDHCLFS